MAKITVRSITRTENGLQVVFNNYRRVWFCENGDFTTDYITNSFLLKYLRLAVNSLTAEEKTRLKVNNNAIVKMALRGIKC